MEELLHSNSQLTDMMNQDKNVISQVWANDDISPASLLYNYKGSNILFEWNPYCMTRLLGPRIEIKGGE